jgi:hypothetical protein
MERFLKFLVIYGIASDGRIFEFLRKSVGSMCSEQFILDNRYPTGLGIIPTGIRPENLRELKIPDS